MNKRIYNYYPISNLCVGKQPMKQAHSVYMWCRYIYDYKYLPAGKLAIAGCLSNKAALANVYSLVPSLSCEISIVYYKIKYLIRTENKRIPLTLL